MSMDLVLAGGRIAAEYGTATPGRAGKVLRRP